LAVNAFVSWLELEGHCLGVCIFVKRRLLILDLVDVPSGHLPEAIAFLEVFDQVEGTLSNEEDVVPSLALSQLKWVGEVVGEHVPGVADDTHELQPWTRILGIFSCSSHDFEQICDSDYSWRYLELVLFVVLLVLLFELVFKQLLGVAVLLKRLLVLGEVDLEDVVEHAALRRDIKLGSLRWFGGKVEELVHTLQEVLLADPEIDVELLGFLFRWVKGDHELVVIIVISRLVATH
jgi:hypothetical protein